MSPEKRVSIGVDEATHERLSKLEQVTGIPKREHLRRAVERYFNDAPDVLTTAASDALAKLPTSLKERARLENVRPVAPGSTTTLRKRTS
jgi:predicted DNA-binding protein